MDAQRDLLEGIKEHSQGNFLGLLRVLIGRRIKKADGTVISNGLTWRELAALLKKAHWNTDCVRELGLDPDKLAPRDRQRFWYTAIAQAGVDTEKATQAGEKMAEVLRKQGYVVG
ncbi:MAG TPA: hypothetical protein VKE98_12670 [Gemmataceae bacterium]|nr:hypothetical protein [Gemmataceae bacterium]